MGDRLDGKIALVTGAGTGIGRAVCVRLAEEGAEVIVTSRTAAHVEETAAEVEAACGRRRGRARPRHGAARADRRRRRRGRGTARPDRRPLEQRGHRARAHAGGLGGDRRGVGARLPRQHDRDLPGLPRRRSAHARRRLDRQHGVDQLLHRLGERRALHGHQGRADAVHESARARRRVRASAPTASTRAPSTRRSPTCFSMQPTIQVRCVPPTRQRRR